MQRTRIREVVFLVTVWVLAAAFIVTFEGAVKQFQSMEPGRPYSLGTQLGVAVVVTAVAGLLMSTFHVGYLSRVLRRRPFGFTLLVTTGFYLARILFFISIAVVWIRARELGVGVLEQNLVAALVAYWGSAEALLTVVYWGGVLLVSFFVVQVSEKFGQGVLVNFLLGRYHRPKEENRIFMFLDLKSSTTTAEQLGHIEYSLLIQDCFYDLTDVVAQHRAMIYQYVGDEVVLTWDVEGGVERADCIRIFHAYNEALRLRSEHYEARYGLVPQFKAGVNAGLVTVAEVGEIKKELAYHGDVLNTAARIQGKCNELGRRLLVSEALKELVEERGDYAFNPMGEVQLKGKAKPVRVFDVAAA